MEVIVIDGGPCGGKTTALARISQELSDLGWKVLIRPEAATLIGECGVSFDLVNRFDLQKAIVETMSKMEDTLFSMYVNHPKCVMICDRGVMSSKPYGAEVFQAVIDNLGLDVASIISRYDGVFHLRSVAVDNPSLYTTANNKIRRETVEEAREKDYATESCWNIHPHFRIIENRGSFEDKIQDLMQHIRACLGEPVKYEHERKFLLRHTVGDIDELPALSRAFKYRIDQHYSNDGHSNRIRKSTYSDSSCLYTHTEKFRDENGLQVEVERILTKSEYEALLPNYPGGISKIRRNFTHRGKFFELDEFLGRESMFVLEVELLHPDEQVELPSFENNNVLLEIEREVTNDPRYSNRNLAFRW